MPLNPIGNLGVLRPSIQRSETDLETTRFLPEYIPSSCPNGRLRYLCMESFCPCRVAYANAKSKIGARCPERQFLLELCDNPAGFQLEEFYIMRFQEFESPYLSKHQNA